MKKVLMANNNFRYLQHELESKIAQEEYERQKAKELEASKSVHGYNWTTLLKYTKDPGFEAIM